MEKKKKLHCIKLQTSDEVCDFVNNDEGKMEIISITDCSRCNCFHLFYRRIK